MVPKLYKLQVTPVTIMGVKPFFNLLTGIGPRLRIFGVMKICIHSRLATLASFHATDKVSLLLFLLSFAKMFIFSSGMPHSDPNWNGCCISNLSPFNFC